MRRRTVLWSLIALPALLAQSSLAATSTVTLTVEGMTGGTGPLTVRRALEGLNGVSRADVSFRNKEARVVFDPSQVTVEQMVEAVTRAGFRAAVKPGSTTR